MIDVKKQEPRPLTIEEQVWRAAALRVRIDRNAKIHAKKKSARKTVARSRRANRSR